jgi:hypothetical protein
MNSSFFTSYPLLIIGLTVVYGWGGAAYAAAFGKTRRLYYLLLSLSWLVFAGIGVASYLTARSGGAGYIFLPAQGGGIFYLVMCFSRRPSAQLFEYGSPRDIMLFKAPLATAPQQEGLFVPQARPQRPSPAAILAVTIGMFGGIWALLASIGWLIRRLL